MILQMKRLLRYSEHEVTPLESYRAGAVNQISWSSQPRCAAHPLHRRLTVVYPSVGFCGFPLLGATLRSGKTDIQGNLRKVQVKIFNCTATTPVLVLIMLCSYVSCHHWRKLSNGYTGPLCIIFVTSHVSLIISK